MSQHFKVCSTCRTPIAFEADYYKCSVSTCNRKRLALFFCSVPCWDAHVPGAGHRDAWAEKEKAPTEAQFLASGEGADDAAPKARRVVSGGAEGSSPSDANVTLTAASTSDVLVVASKLKAYIKERSGMNTSQGVMDALSHHLRAACDQAIREAAKNERKTVLDRDVEAVLRRLWGAPSGSAE